MRLVREGLLRYWKNSDRGRAASMALLSTHEGRMSVMARQYARVVGYAIPELIAWGRTADAKALGSRRQALIGLSRSTAKYAVEAIRGYIDGVYVPRSPAEARHAIRLRLARFGT
jgi:hypothetical protein